VGLAGFSCCDVSYFKNNEFSSSTEFECHAGAFTAAVALKASYAKTPERSMRLRT